MAGNDAALLGQAVGNTGVLEDAVKDSSRGSADLVRHARDRRGGSIARLACDKGAAEQKHEQETRGDGLVLVLCARDERDILVLLGSGLVVRGKVVDKDVVVPVAVAHVEVVHVRS